jgi:DNA-nicking Smr family endonuclease
MRDEFALRERHAAEQALAAKRQAQARLEEATRFSKAVSDVTPLPQPDRVDPLQLRRHTRPDTSARQLLKDERAALLQSMSDEMDIERLLDTDEGLAFRQEGIGQDVVRKLRKGHWVVQASLDLHGLRVDEARERIAVFLQNCVKREMRCARIIHGKGLGSINREPVLKAKVHRWLAQREEVLAWVQAGPADGGSGAVLVLINAK